jgi:hypothetical protein
MNIYANNSEPENGTEQIASFSDYTPEEYEDVTEASNSSESGDTPQRVRTFNIETDLAGPDSQLPTERTLSVSCHNPKITCVSLRCRLYGRIRNKSKASISINMSAKLDALGESSFCKCISRFKIRSCKVNVTIFWDIPPSHLLQDGFLLGGFSALKIMRYFSTKLMFT